MYRKVYIRQALSSLEISGQANIVSQLDNNQPVVSHKSINYDTYKIQKIYKARMDSQPFRKPSIQPASQPASQSTGASQPTSKQANQSSDKTANQSAGHSASQLASQPNS